MTFDSLEFKQMLAGFGRDLKEVDERLYEASQGELAGEESSEAVARANSKLAAYETLLLDPRLDAVKRSQVVAKFSERIQSLRTQLMQIP